MESDQRIIIRFTADYPGLFGNMEKLFPLINHHLSKETLNNFYIESIENGAVYFYNDFNTFNLMNQPYDIKEIQEFINKKDLELEPTCLIEDILTKDSFPADRINFLYKIVAPDLKKVRIMLIKHFKSFLGDLMEVKEDEKYDLVFHMKEFETIFIYCKLVASMYSGILSE